MKSLVTSVFIVASLLLGCKKKVEVSDIYLTDSMGNLMAGLPNDNQWKNMTLTNAEISLFKDLDTADLTGTTLPMLNTTSYGFPNPFNHQINLNATLTQPLNGDIVIKYVVVNNNMNSVLKGSLRIYATSFFSFTVPGTFNSGKYRLYYTYSAAGNEHFFKSWGNIQKL